MLFFFEVCGTEDAPNLAELLSRLPPSCKTQSLQALWLSGGAYGVTRVVVLGFLLQSSFFLRPGARGCFF